MKKTFTQNAMSVRRLYLEKRVSTLSSSLAYYLTMTLIPGTIVIKSITDTFSDEVFEGARLLFPKGLMGFFDYGSVEHERELVTTSALVSLYYLLRAVKSLKHHVDLIYGKKEKKSLAYSLTVSALVSFFFLCLVFICGALILLGANIIRLPLFLRKPALMSVSVSFCAALAFLFLVCVFKLLPDRRVKSVAYGTLFSLVLWCVLTWAFSLYLKHFQGTMPVYGSLASVVALMLWLYALSNIILTGACVNLLFCGGKASREAVR